MNYMMGITDRDRMRLRSSFKVLFRDSYDVLDIDAEIDSTLSFEENYNHIKDKYDILTEQVDNYKHELMMYEKSLVDSIPMDDKDFMMMMNDIKLVMESPGIKSHIKSRLLKDAISKLSNLDHLRDQKKDKISKVIKEYAGKYNIQQ